jgi:hypothetical protein
MIPCNSSDDDMDMDSIDGVDGMDGIGAMDEANDEADNDVAIVYYSSFHLFAPLTYSII